MPTQDSDQILFAVLSVQFGFVKPDQLSAVTREWIADPSVSLADFLVQKKLITSEQRKMIEGLKAESLHMRGSDAAETILSMGGNKAVKQAFGGKIELSEDAATFNVREQAEDFNTESGPFFEEQPGRYTILGEHGRGGQARVYLAFDAQVGREVAMKVLRPEGEKSQESSTPGSFTTPVTVRFVREARITGELEHPNIVPVHEIGFRSDGQPYYTMQLVRGETLAKKLSTCRTLSERLKLLGPFWDLCNAIAFAHTRGVIHRDIKPSNVMVGEFGETVVLDWGVAKVKGSTDLRAKELERQIRLMREDQTLETMVGSTIGTPSYMSPEQALGNIDEIDERSDVWGLGAVLYEILTGGPPFDGHLPYEVITKVVDEPIPKVTHFCQDAPPDLVAVVDKALQREQGQRYQSARDLAEEVSAYMTGGRVQAYSYSSWQLLKRFAGRNKLVLSSIAVALVLLVTLSVGAYFRVSAERDRAEAQRTEAMKFANLLVNDLFEKVKPLIGSTEALDTLVTSTLRYFNKHVDPLLGEPHERFSLAVTYRKVGDVALALGKTAQAREAKDQSEKIAKQLLALQPDNIEFQKEHARSLLGLLAVHDSNTTIEANFAMANQGLAEARRLLEARPNDRDIQFLVMDFRFVLGNLEGGQSKFAPARIQYEAALALQRTVMKERPDDIQLLDRMAKVYNRLTRVARFQYQMDEAMQLARQALEISKHMLSVDPNNQKSQYILFLAYYTLGGVAARIGDRAGSREYLQQALALAKKLADADPTNHDAKRDLLAATEASARALVFDQKIDEALKQYRQTIAAARKIVNEDPASGKSRATLFFCLVKFSELAMDLGKNDLAHSQLQEAQEMTERMVEADPSDLWAQGEKAWTLYRLAATSPGGHNGPQARETCRRYLKQAARVLEMKDVKEEITRGGRGYCWAVVGEEDRFHDLIRMADEKKPGGYSRGFDLVEAHLLTGKYPEAIELGTKLLTHKDCRGRRVATLNLYLGISQILAGKRDAAIGSFTRALRRVEKTVDHKTPRLEMFTAEALLSRLKSPHRPKILALLSALGRWTNLENPEPLKKQLGSFIAWLRK